MTSCSRAFLFDSPSHALLPCRGVVVSWGRENRVLLVSSRQAAGDASDEVADW
jgi:hypothetical protein